MPNDYILEYIPEDHYRKDRMRKIALFIALILDLVAILTLGAAIFDPKLWIAIATIVLFDNTMRIGVNLLPKKYRYGIKNGKFEVVEVTPLKNKSIISHEVSEVAVSRIDPLAADISKDTLKLTDNSCQLTTYMVKLGEKQIVIGLDEYLYALIDGMYSKISNAK